MSDALVLDPALKPDAEADGGPAPAPELTASSGAAREGSQVGKIVRRGLRVFVVAVLAFLVFALWLSGLAHARSQVGMQRRFRVELANGQAPIGGAIPAGAPVAIIDVPRIGVHEVVVEGTRSGQLRKGPGHLVGTPLPGQPGNAVLAGRRTLYGGPFGHLGSLRAGDRIEVTTGQGQSSFAVENVANLESDNGSFAQYRDDNRLTLFTSGSRLTASSRLVVSATMIGKPFAPTTLRRTLDPDGLGLTGERDAAAYTLVWLELSAAAALLAVFVATRWSKIATWVICAPVLALMLWLFFQSGVRLLPAIL